jgi:hypothetical protein
MHVSSNSEVEMKSIIAAIVAIFIGLHAVADVTKYVICGPIDNAFARVNAALGGNR